MCRHVLFDGVQYGILAIKIVILRPHRCFLWLRQDWMDELGLEAPKTIDDLKGIMDAFMEKVGDGAVGMALCNDLYGNLMDIVLQMHMVHTRVTGYSRMTEHSYTAARHRDEADTEALADLYQNGYLMKSSM